MWKQQAKKLFEGWDASLLHAYLGGGRGSILVDDESHITAALIDIGDFCFLTGEPSEQLLAKISDSKLLVPRDGAWEKLIEAFYGSRAEKFTRYAIKKEPDIFDKAKLQAYGDALGTDYTLRFFDQEAFERALSEEWSYDLCSQFDDYADYEKRGLGVAIFHEGMLVAGAAPYATYPDGIEIEIDTKPEYRQKGLATVCGAALILECQQRGLYPGWDAHDLRSLALAEKLGYHLDCPYTAYELTEEGTAMNKIITLRKFEDSNLSIFQKWLYLPHVAAWYHDSLDWLDEVKNRNDKFAFLHHFMVEQDDESIGFAQFYEYHHSGEDWHGDTELAGTYSIDYLIGNTDYLGKGLGKAIVSALVGLIKTQAGAERIIVQPEPENKASCGALRSSGFAYDDKNEIYVMRLR